MDILTVKSLGKFQLLYNGKLLNEDTMRSDMLAKLLIYMLLHRDAPVTVQELSEALWDEEETENPAGALKNLMYRLRTLLKKYLGDEEFIVTGRGTYSWNEKITVFWDTEQFEQYCDTAKRETEMVRQIGCYENAIALYQGDFMAKLADKHWIITLSAYYHSMLLTAIKSLTELYRQEARYEDMERICSVGLKYDMVDEWLHCHRIRALICQNKQMLAMECYEQAVKVLYDTLGVRSSAQLESVYEELLSMSKGSEAEGLERVHADMQEEEEPEGAYICGYPVFRAIYRLEARKISRMEASQYVMLLTLQRKEDAATGNEQMEKFILNQGMEQMKDVLKTVLRIGDVAARCSDSQYVILLPTCTYESCLSVSERIIKHFQEKNKGKRITVKSEFKEMTRASAWIK